MISAQCSDRQSGGVSNNRGSVAEAIMDFRSSPDVATSAVGHVRAAVVLSAVLVMFLLPLVLLLLRLLLLQMLSMETLAGATQVFDNNNRCPDIWRTSQIYCCSRH